MSSNFRPQQQFNQFRESLTYEEKIAGQVSRCLDAFNENNEDFMHSTIDALLTMIPTRLYDKDFAEELLALDGSWESEKQEAVKRYEKKRRAARGGCPDLVARPRMQPSREYWEKKFVILINLFDRAGIGLKMRTSETI